jgi:hypothetical protein
MCVCVCVCVRARRRVAVSKLRLYACRFPCKVRRCYMILIKIGIYQKIVIKVPSIKFRFFSCRRTDMAKLIGTLLQRFMENAPVSKVFILPRVPGEISSHRIGNCRGTRGSKRENWHILCSWCTRLGSEFFITCYAEQA